MEYLTEVIWYLSLPVVVFVALKFVFFSLKTFEKNALENES
jgi:hypothetical protein